MYNHQLDTFKLVADCKSFTAASKQLYVSPSAVLQQINSLEDNLKVKLFNRTNQGLSLTPAGEYLYKECTLIFESNSVIRSALLALQAGPVRTLQIGFPRMHKLWYFYELWTNYSITRPEQNIEFSDVMTSNSPEMTALYNRLDLVEYPYFGFEWQKSFDFLPIRSCPVSLGVPRKHPLSSKVLVTLEDMKGEHLVIHSGQFTDILGSNLDRLYACGVKPEFTDTYTSGTLGNCIIKNKLILVMDCTRGLNRDLNVIPIDWDAEVPYGFLCSKQMPRGEGSFYEYIVNNLGSVAQEW